MLAGPAFVAVNHGTTAGRTEPHQPPLVQVTAYFQSIHLQDNCSLGNDMDGVVARDKKGETLWKIKSFKGLKWREHKGKTAKRMYDVEWEPTRVNDAELTKNDNDVSIAIDVAPPRSLLPPAKEISLCIRPKILDARTVQALGLAPSPWSFPFNAELPFLSGAANQNKDEMCLTPTLFFEKDTEFPTECPPQVVTTAPRSPRKCLSEKALSVHCLMESSGTTKRKSPSRRQSRSTSAAELSPMASSLSKRTLPSATSANSRWDLSYSSLDRWNLSCSSLDCPPTIASSPDTPVLRKSQQKIIAGQGLSAVPLKTFEANPPSEASLQPAPVADTKTLPPMTVRRRAALAEARWDSSQSLNDCPPKLPIEEHDSNDSSPNAGDLAPRPPRRTPQAKTPSKASSQSSSTADADKALPPKTVYQASLADARWDSSRSFTDNAPQTPTSPSKKKQKDSSHLRGLLGLRRDAPDHKSISQANARWDSSRSLADNAPQTPTSPSKKKQKDSSHLRALLGLRRDAPDHKSISQANARWDSSRSLTDNAPQTPTSPSKKKQKDSSHLRGLLGLRRDAPDHKSIVPPALPVDETLSPSMRNRQSIMSSPLPSESHTCFETPPTSHSRKAMSRKGESSGTGKRKNRASPRHQLSLLKSTSVVSSKTNNEHTLKDAFDDEYAKLIDDFKRAVPATNFA
jgi:hypothetical protein